MRVKTGFTRKKRHKKILKATKGYRGSRGKLIRMAKESFLHSGEYAFAGRRLKKRDFRKLWIIRLNASLREMGLKYSLFISALKKSNIKLEKKVLSQIAFYKPEVFKEIVEKVTKS